MKTVTKLLIILTLISTSCTNKKTEVQPIVDEPEIMHLQDTYYYRYFLFQNFQDNESCIKYLFDFVKKEKGDKWIMTNSKGVLFDDGSAILDTLYQRFSIENTNNYFKNVKVNFKHSTKIGFIDKAQKNKVELNAKFEMLDLNILQNMLDYAKEDENKKKNKSFTYELYNKDNIRKVVIVYHNYGEWFSINIL